SRLVEQPPPTPAESARLLITEPGGTEREFNLSGGGITIGKSEDNQLRLADGAISRKHAVIEADGDGLTLRDLGSLNGIFVNRQRVGEQGLLLQDGDQIELGRTKMVFRSAPSQPAPRAAAPKHDDHDDEDGALRETVVFAAAATPPPPLPTAPTPPPP